jgi:hypothetical protein
MFAALDNFKAEELSKAFQETLSPAQFSFTMQQAIDNLLTSDKNSDESYHENLSSIHEFLEARIPCYKDASDLNSSTLTTILHMLQRLPEDRPSADDLIGKFGERAYCNTGPEEMKRRTRTMNIPMHGTRIVWCGLKLYSRVAGPNRIQNKSAQPLWMQSAVSSSTADYHLSGTVSEELEERRRYQFLLTNHMFGGRH